MRNEQQWLMEKEEMRKPDAIEEFGKMIVKGLEIQADLKAKKKMEEFRIRKDAFKEDKAFFMPIIEYLAKHRGEWKEENTEKLCDLVEANGGYMGWAEIETIINWIIK